MAGAQVDVSEIRSLAADLGAASERAVLQSRKVMQKAALNIKNDMIDEATGVSESFDRVRFAISYETFAGPDGWVAEIGPETGYERGHVKGQGGLAWIAYEGHATTGPVFPDPSGALEREAEAFRAYLAEAVTDDLL